jgi:DDE superfamily endonuclease
MMAVFYPYFKDCISTIDGSHIPAFVPKAKCMPFCNCKGQISQNILAACSFEFKFVYVLSGWEGSASDSLVYQDARMIDFYIPDGRYYLTDSGYLNTVMLLASYQSAHYHLKEWKSNREKYDSILLSESIASMITGPKIIRNYSIFNMCNSETLLSAYLVY